MHRHKINFDNLDENKLGRSREYLKVYTGIYVVLLVRITNELFEKLGNTKIRMEQKNNSRQGSNGSHQC